MKIFLCVAIATLVTSTFVYSDPDPLTAEIKAQLHSPVITIVAEGFLTSEGVEKVKEKGPAYIAKSRREPGNIQYQLQFDASDLGHIFWYEQYASSEAFETHLNSSYSKAWVEMLKPLSTKPIVIHFLNKIEHVEN